jgi:quercetin dioxygenase-like cupin family protein
LVISVHIDKVRSTNPSGFEGVTQRIVYADGLMIQKVDATGRTYLPFHRHPETQLSLVLRGTIEVKVEKEKNVFEKLKCSKGYVFWIPSNALHDASIVSDAGASWLSIYTPPRESYKSYAVGLSW